MAVLQGAKETEVGSGNGSVSLGRREEGLVHTFTPPRTRQGSAENSPCWTWSGCWGHTGGWFPVAAISSVA